MGADKARNAMSLRSGGTRLSTIAERGGGGKSVRGTVVGGHKAGGGSCRHSLPGRIGERGQKDSEDEVPTSRRGRRKPALDMGDNIRLLQSVAMRAASGCSPQSSSRSCATSDDRSESASSIAALDETEESFSEASSFDDHHDSNAARSGDASSCSSPCSGLAWGGECSLALTDGHASHDVTLRSIEASLCSSPRSEVVDLDEALRHSFGHVSDNIVFEHPQQGSELAENMEKRNLAIENALRAAKNLMAEASGSSFPYQPQTLVHLSSSNSAEQSDDALRIAENSMAEAPGAPLSASSAILRQYERAKQESESLDDNTMLIHRQAFDRPRRGSESSNDSALPSPCPWQAMGRRRSGSSEGSAMQTEGTAIGTARHVSESESAGPLPGRWQDRGRRGSDSSDGTAVKIQGQAMGTARRGSEASEHSDVPSRCPWQVMERRGSDSSDHIAAPLSSRRQTRTKSWLDYGPASIPPMRPDGLEGYAADSCISTLLLADNETSALDACLRSRPAGMRSRQAADLVSMCERLQGKSRCDLWDIDSVCVEPSQQRHTEEAPLYDGHGNAAWTGRVSFEDQCPMSVDRESKPRACAGASSWRSPPLSARKACDFHAETPLAQVSLDETPCSTPSTSVADPEEFRAIDYKESACQADCLMGAQTSTEQKPRTVEVTPGPQRDSCYALHSALAQMAAELRVKQQKKQEQQQQQQQHLQPLTHQREVPLAPPSLKQPKSLHKNAPKPDREKSLELECSQSMKQIASEIRNLQSQVAQSRVEAEYWKDLATSSRTSSTQVSARGEPPPLTDMLQTCVNIIDSIKTNSGALQPKDGMPPVQAREGSVPHCYVGSMPQVHSLKMAQCEDVTTLANIVHTIQALKGNLSARDF